MKASFKSLALAALSIICASAMAGQRPIPQLYTGKFTAATPIRAAKVRMLPNGKIQMLSNWVNLNSNPWSKIKGDAGISQVGTLDYDAYEGTGGAGSQPTDGLYNENFSLTGSRWYLGDAWVNTNEARYIQKLFPGRDGVQALGIDFVFYLNNGFTGNEIEYIFHFTYEDDLDLNNLVAPSTIYDGVVLQYTPLTTAGGYYSNVDLTGSGAFMQMPMDGKGGHIEIIASDFDGTNITYSAGAQPMLWGTKPENPSKMSHISLQDGPGDGSGRDGQYDTAYDWTFAVKPAPVSYTTPNGTETSTHDVAKLAADDDDKVVIRGKLAATEIGKPQAAIEASITVPDDATLGFALFAETRLFRSEWIVNTNGRPFGNSDYRWRAEIYNRSTSLWETRFTGTPVINQEVTITTSSILFANLGNYVDVATRDTDISFDMFNTRPLAQGWVLEIDLGTTPVSYTGPDPLGPGTGFSGP
jgi:hypothetical protein